MKKTYVTSMPNHIGAFLKASKCFSALGINITRVSYNKAVDSHTLFIDAEGSEEQLRKADAELDKIGYLQNDKSSKYYILDKLLRFYMKNIQQMYYNFNLFQIAKMLCENLTKRRFPP